MAAERHLGGRREPPEREHAVAPLDECGLGEVHLRRHALHPGVRSARVEETHRGGVAGERVGRERINREDGDGHR